MSRNGPLEDFFVSNSRSHMDPSVGLNGVSAQPPFRIGAGMVCLPRPALRLCFDRFNNHVSAQNLPDTPGKAAAAGQQTLA